MSGLEGLSEGFFVGNYFFSTQKCVLILGEVEIYCNNQEVLLLLAFRESTDCFLSHEKIARICSWPLNACGLNERRRTAIAQLRRLFIDHSVDIISVRNRKGYQLVVRD